MKRKVTGMKSKNKHDRIPTPKKCRVKVLAHKCFAEASTNSQSTRQ
jgi:hypothetical protein